jgi:NTE family protein
MVHMTSSKGTTLATEKAQPAASPAEVAPKHLHQTKAQFEQAVLLLQGGGALGSYQAGVYQALAEVDLHPDWIAGISIGAVNSALIAGNPPKERVGRLREFWEAISTSPLGFQYFPSAPITDDSTHSLLNQARALGILLFGAPHFFTPRLPLPMPWDVSRADAVSYYNVSPLKATLERLVDFDRINAGATRLSVGAVNVRTGNFVRFDTGTHRITPAHIIASGSLPPGFPATEIDGEYYWDGGLVSNTPLQWVLDSRPRRDTLAFEVDLWPAQGKVPRNLADADVRQKEIRFSSRSRAGTDLYKYTQRLRIALATLLERLPDELLGLPEVAMLAAEANDKVCNIVHLIYRAKKYEGSAKDYEFSRRTMEEHWLAGYRDTVNSLRHREIFEPPHRLEGVRTFDFSKTRQL